MDKPPMVKPPLWTNPRCGQSTYGQSTYGQTSAVDKPPMVKPPMVKAPVVKAPRTNITDELRRQKHTNANQNKSISKFVEDGGRTSIREKVRGRKVGHK